LQQIEAERTAQHTIHERRPGRRNQPDVYKLRAQATDWSDDTIFHDAKQLGLNI
jgi:hypothetical protein